MKVAWSALLLPIAFSFPFIVSADSAASLVWGGQRSGIQQITIVDGGTYNVLLNELSPVYFVPPFDDPDDEILVLRIADLYRVDDAGRTFIEFVRTHHEDDPDNPDDGDALFAWPAAGEYELDILAFEPPPAVNFEDGLRRWLAWMFFADIAYAQFSDPEIVFETIHFTIVDANAVPDPVIIIPGILGSEQHNGQWMIDPILHTYDDLIATLDANGYTLEQDLFPYPYDWRNSNVETAVLLKQKIDEVKGICGCDKVDLVAHSMGGLVARQYIQSEAYENDVDQLIFLGTPHLGAPKAYSVWEAGEYSPGLLPIEDSLIELMLKHEAAEQNYPSLFDYIRTKPIPSVGELLPIYDYIFDGNVLRSYPANYSRNLFLENLNNQIGNLLSSGIRISNITGETGTNETIIGIQSANPAAFLPRWEHGYPDGFSNIFGDHGLIRGQGDGTVPFNSATFITENLDVTASPHNALPENTQTEIFKVLTRQDVLTVIDNINLANLKIILFKIFSPADFLVIAPDGKKIGKDFNGQEVNEILNAFYTGFNTDTEFITILNPLDGEYKIFAHGTGSGPYTMETNFISDATTTEASFTGNTAPGITSELSLEVEDSGIAPDALDVVVTHKSTLADIDRLYALGWLRKSAYKDIRDDFKNAFKKKKKGKRAVDKGDLKDILEDLEDYRDDREINEQGYQIIKTDIEQLIKN